MKTVAISAVALWVSLSDLSAQPVVWASAPRLMGIVSLPHRQWAVLKPAEVPESWDRWLILSERQADEGIRVTKIAADTGSVESCYQGTNRATVRLRNETNLPVLGVVLEDVGLGTTLHLFGQLTNRTLLRWPALPAASFDFRAAANDRAGAARILAEALAAKGLAIIPDGDRFLMIVPKAEAASVKPHAPRAKSPPSGVTRPHPAPTEFSEEEQVHPPYGLIDFRNVDVAQVLPIYAEMVHCKLEPGKGRSPYGTINLTTQPGLTMEEGIYAVETLLLWNGIKMVPVGKDAIKPVPADRD